MAILSCKPARLAARSGVMIGIAGAHKVLPGFAKRRPWCANLKAWFAKEEDRPISRAPGPMPRAAAAYHPAPPSRSSFSFSPVAALLLAAALWLALPGAAAADGGVISGVVTNGTANGSVPADIAVTLYFLRDGQIVEQRTDVTGADGSYRFSELPTDPDVRFVAVAAFAQVPYNTAEMQFSDTSEIEAAPLVVYESGQDVSVVRVVTNVLIIAPGEERSGMLSVIEVVRLANDSDRTFLATGVGDSGAPMDRVLRFQLPANAQDLTMLSGLNSQNVVQIDRGFGVFMPLFPGEREVAFGYQLPYSGNTLAIAKRTVYPTEQFAILAQEEYGLRFSAPQLEVEPTTIGERRYVVGTTADLASRADVTVRIEGLPAPALRVRLERILTSVRDARTTLYAALAVVFVLPVLYAAYRLHGSRRRRAAAPLAESAAPPARQAMSDSTAAREALLTEIAQLDDDYAAGSVVADEYRRLRDNLKERLMALHRAPDVEIQDG